MEILIFYQTHVCGLFQLICSNDIMNTDKLVIKLATKVICKDNRRKGNKKNRYMVSVHRLGYCLVLQEENILTYILSKRN